MNKKQREEKIEAILNTVEDWDLKDLVRFVATTIEERLHRLTEKELQEEYRNAVGRPPCPECGADTEATAGTDVAGHVSQGIINALTEGEGCWRLCPKCGWDGSPWLRDIPLLVLQKIAEVRDAGVHGIENYPAGTVGDDQCFDDWAADMATGTIEALGEYYIPPED